MIFQPGKCWETLEESFASMNHTSADQSTSPFWGLWGWTTSQKQWSLEVWNLPPTEKKQQNHQTWKFWREVWYGWALWNQKKGELFFWFRLMKLMKHDFFSPFERIEQNIGKESSVVNASEFHHCFWPEKVSKRILNHLPYYHQLIKSQVDWNLQMLPISWFEKKSISTKSTIWFL